METQRTMFRAAAGYLTDSGLAKVGWMVGKDLVSEWRARRAWPAMLLLGIVVALVFSIQIDLPPDEKLRIVGGLLWLAVFFAGLIALDRSLAAEHDDGCWQGLLLYPVAPTAIYLAKLTVNLVAFAAVQCVLLPLFSVLADVPLLARPGPMLVVVLLGNLALAAVGTLLGALAAGIRHAGGLSALLVLPLAIPVVLAGAEATRLIVADDFGAAWWRWTGFLAACAAVFVVAGSLLFEYVIEE